MTEFEVLSNPPIEKTEKVIEEPCLVRINGNINLTSYGIQSDFQGNPSDKMFDVPCNLQFFHICAIEMPTAETQIDQMIGSEGGSWKRLKTSQVFWKLGSNPSTFDEAEATCTGKLILEVIFNLVQSSKNEPNHCPSTLYIKLKRCGTVIYY